MNAKERNYSYLLITSDTPYFAAGTLLTEREFYKRLAKYKLSYVWDAPRYAGVKTPASNIIKLSGVRTFRDAFKLTQTDGRERIMFADVRLEDSGLVAFFPDMPEPCPEDSDSTYVLCYAPIGQHSKGDVNYFRSLPKANRAEAHDLLQELRTIYQNVVLI